MGAQRQQAQGRHLLLDGRAEAIVDHQNLPIPLLLVRLEELDRQFPGLLVGHLTHEQVSVGCAQVDAAIRQKIASLPPDSDHIDRGIPAALAYQLSRSPLHIGIEPAAQPAVRRHHHQQCLALLPRR